MVDLGEIAKKIIVIILAVLLIFLLERLFRNMLGLVLVMLGIDYPTMNEEKFKMLCGILFFFGIGGFFGYNIYNGIKRKRYR